MQDAMLESGMRLLHKLFRMKYLHAFLYGVIVAFITIGAACAAVIVCLLVTLAVQWLLGA